MIVIAYHFPKRSRKSLQLGLGLLGLRDELDDACQRRIAACPRHFEGQGPIEISQRRPGVPLPFFWGQDGFLL